MYNQSDKTLLCYSSNYVIGHKTFAQNANGSSVSLEVTEPF